MATIDLQELKDFHKMVDSVIDGIETGTIKTNPLAPESTDISEADAKDVVVAETANETGENTRKPEVEENMADVMGFNEAISNDSEPSGDACVTINGTSFAYAEDEEDVIGSPSKNLVIISTNKGEVIFGNAATAGRELGFHPTTVRERCVKEYVDTDDNVWSYRENNPS
jgi:hypothetical protein